MSQQVIAENPQGLVLEIQRMSTEDGPGLRTTVFFKGCPLKCAWCHNPESISPKPQTQWLGTRCIGCRTCQEVCPSQALSWSDDGLVIDRARCQACGICARECPTTALELLGRPWTARDLVREVAKDRAYFAESGGGVTASGGEATLQSDFVAAFFQTCRQAGLSTALDTSGLCSREALAATLPWTDLLLYDLKLIDPERHRHLTGVSNRIILDNLLFIREWMKSNLAPRALWIRTPLIPGATNDPDNIIGVGRFIASNLKGVVARWDLCAFNHLARDKYRRLGLTWDYADTPLMTTTELAAAAQLAGESGVSPDLIHAGGPTRADPDQEPRRETEDQQTVGPRLTICGPARGAL